MDLPSSNKEVVITQPDQNINYGLILLGSCWLLFGTFLLYQHPTVLPPIVIRWETETEFDTAGFNIHRSDAFDGEYVVINSEIIPSQAEPATGMAYEFVDQDVALGQTYFYVLEDIEYNNQRTLHPPLAHKINWFNAFSTHALTLLSLVIGLWLLLKQFIWRIR